MTAHDGSRFLIRRGAIAIAMFALAIGGVNACAHGSRVESAPTGSPPPYLIGTFVDDYGGHHAISASEWRQGDDDRYHIVRWNADEHYLIAENNSSGPTSLGRWTRIDWVHLDGMAPYAWAFCFSAFQMKTAAAAESSMAAAAGTPRNGCNGYPFTRMRAVHDSP